MSDGNTGFQVAPVTKEEAVNLQSMFSKIAQALVDASSLPDQVKALQGELDTLRRDLQNKTTHAEELDKSLAEVRQQRDEARRESSELGSQLRTAQRDLDGAKQIIERHIQSIQSLQTELDKARHDRDEYGLQVLSLEDQVKAWKEKAEKARVRLNDVLSVFKQEEPEPEPIPAFIQPKTEEPKPETTQAPSAYDPGEPPHPVFDSPDAPQPSAPSPAMQSDQGQSASSPSASAPPTETGQSAQSSGANETGDASQNTTIGSSTDGPQYLDHWEPGAIWDSAANKYRLDH